MQPGTQSKPTDGKPWLRNAGFWTSDTYWVLEIEKECPGVDFFASFRVPIYDVPDAPASEQRAE